MKIAFIHDWLDTYRGGEKVLEALLSLYPNAPIYTMFYEPRDLPASITGRDVQVPRWCQIFRSKRKALLPFYPRIVESYRLEEFDLLISSSSCAAKGVIPPKGAKHLCYIHSPMRYIWDQKEHYFRGKLSWPGLKQLADAEAARLRRWDVASAQPRRVHRFVANSSFVQSRVRAFYGRESAVVHPPIEDRFFSYPLSAKSESYFIAAGAFVAYKRFDLAVAACKASGKRLILAGSGPDTARLKSMLAPNMELIHNPSDAQMAALVSGAQALLFPGVEDFGMVPVEAMALGTPVIALAEGGALDYLRPGENGLGVASSTIDEWKDALKGFDPVQFNANDLRSFAKQFSIRAFLDKMRAEIQHTLQG